MLLLSLLYSTRRKKNHISQSERSCLDNSQSKKTRKACKQTSLISLQLHALIAWVNLNLSSLNKHQPRETSDETRCDELRLRMRRMEHDDGLLWRLLDTRHSTDADADVVRPTPSQSERSARMRTPDISFLNEFVPKCF